MTIYHFNDDWIESLWIFISIIDCLNSLLAFFSSSDDSFDKYTEYAIEPMPKNKLINIPIIPIFKEPFADFVIAFKFSSAFCKTLNVFVSLIFSLKTVFNTWKYLIEFFNIKCSLPILWLFCRYSTFAIINWIIDWTKICVIS